MATIVQRSAEGLSYLSCDGGGDIPVVLLHGIGSNAQSFEPLMQAMASRYPSLAWDAPGYGDSKPLTVAWPDASDYANALERLLARLEVKRCIVVGHSLGCLTAARYAMIAPVRLAALVLISPALGYFADKGGLLPPGVAARLNDLDRLGPEAFAAKRAPGLLANPAQSPDVLAAVERAMAAVRRPGYDHAARMLATGQLLDDAAKIEAPAAVITASEDRITPVENGHFVFAALQRSSKRPFFRIIKNAGHAVCQERPEEVAQVIAEFVEADAGVRA
jgi:pimeloyl-ACP methyl ester carboxylesterase